VDDWKRFACSILVLVLSGIGVVFALNYVVDPYDMNGKFQLGLDKEGISQPMNYRLFSLARFSRDPKVKIIFGDSRALGLREDYFQAAGADNWRNMGIGGGTLYEEIESFYFALSKVGLKRAVFVIPFNLYNDNQRHDEVPDSINVVQNPGKYYINGFVARVSLLILYSKISGRRLEIGKPTMSKDEFWDYQLGPNMTGNFYSQWSYPRDLLNKLTEAKEVCDKRGIEMTIVLPPTHVDLQGKTKDYGLEKAYSEYKKNLSCIANVIDFDFPNDLTRNRDLFIDPYHSTPPVGKLIVSQILGRDSSYGRRYSCRRGTLLSGGVPLPVHKNVTDRVGDCAATLTAMRPRPPVRKN